MNLIVSFTTPWGWSDKPSTEQILSYFEIMSDVCFCYIFLQDYIAFKTELDRREKVYLKLGEKVATKKAARLTEQNWKDLDTNWKQVARKTRLWLWKLDTSLPGRLGKFGDWVNRAEELLESEIPVLDDPEDTADNIAKLTHEHRVIILE